MSRNKPLTGDLMPDRDGVHNIGGPNNYISKAYIRELVGGAIASGGGANKPYATYVVAASNSAHPDAVNADYVCTGVDDQDTINTAISNAYFNGYFGGEVLLLDGRFAVTGSIVMNDGINLEGLGEENTIIDIADNEPSTFSYITGSSISYSSIRNLSLGGKSGAATGGTDYKGIDLSGCVNITIENVNFSSFDGTGSRAIYGDNQCEIIKISNCHFEINQGNCIHFTGTFPNRYIFIERCSFQGNDRRDIYIDTSEFVLIEHNNHISHSLSRNINDIRNSNYIVVSDSTFDRGLTGVYIQDCSSITVDSNIYYKVDTGVYYYATSSADVRNVDISNNTFDLEDSADGSNGIEIYADFPGAAVPIPESRTLHGVVIEGNTFYGAPDDFFTSSGSGKLAQIGWCDTVTVSGNVVMHCGIGLYFYDVTNLTVDSNSISDCFNDGIVIDYSYDLPTGGTKWATVSNNSIRESSGDGIGLVGPGPFNDDPSNEDEMAAMLAVVGNSIRDCNTGITAQVVANLTITGNSVAECNQGIEFVDVWKAIISDNILTKNMYPMYIANNVAGECLVTNNAFFHTERVAFYFSGGVKCIFDSNLIVDTNTVGASGAATIEVYSSDNTISNNIIQAGYSSNANDYAIAVDINNNLSITGTVIRDNVIESAAWNTQEILDNGIGTKIYKIGHVLVTDDTNRDSAGSVGKIIFNTDDGQLNIDDGTNWTLPDGTIT